MTTISSNPLWRHRTVIRRLNKKKWVEKKSTNGIHRSLRSRDRTYSNQNAKWQNKIALSALPSKTNILNSNEIQRPRNVTKRRNRIDFAVGDTMGDRQTMRCQRINQKKMKKMNFTLILTTLTLSIILRIHVSNRTNWTLWFSSEKWEITSLATQFVCNCATNEN